MTASDAQSLSIKELLALANDDDREGLPWTRRKTGPLISMRSPRRYGRIPKSSRSTSRTTRPAKSWSAIASLPMYGLGELRTALRRDDMLQTVREAFIRHSNDEVVSPAPGQLLFEHPSGDCHIKYGYFKGRPVFAIKIAMGFYENPSRGLSTNNGLVLVFDARTGKTKAILNDQGWLTTWRTAAAGALAAQAGAPSQITALGIVGTGHQAEHQARWASALLGTDRVVIWGRDQDKAARLARQLGDLGLRAESASTVEQLLAQSNVVITCTPRPSRSSRRRPSSQARILWPWVPTARGNRSWTRYSLPSPGW